MQTGKNKINYGEIACNMYYNGRGNNKMCISELGQKYRKENYNICIQYVDYIVR